MSQIKHGFIASTLFLSGCVGTDIINESTIMVPARVEITPRATAIEVGTEAMFRATYFDSLGNQASPSFTWQSLHPEIAGIDQAGLARGILPGQAMVVASARGLSSEPALLTVVADPNQVATVVVTPDSGEIQIGESMQFSAEAFNLSGGSVSGVTFTWSSSNSDVATIDGSGRATASGSGTTNITAQADGVESSPAYLEVLPETRSGTFTRRPGTSYSVSGTAVLQRQSDGRLLLRFENDFNSSNGPGLAVYLSPSQNVGASSLSLGSLKKTSGAQEYEVPAGVEIMTYNWVIIHCVPFNVTFGYAQLQ